MKNLLLALIAILLAPIAGCRCFKPEHRNEPACAVLNQVVDCTESAVVTNIAQFKPLLQQVIALATGQGGQIDWSKVEQALTGMGIKDGGCIMADLEKDFMTPASTPMINQTLAATRASYHDNYKSYRAKRWPNISFKVKKAGGGTVTL